MPDVVYRADGETRSFPDAQFVLAVQQALRDNQDASLVADARWGNATSTALLAYARGSLSVGVVGAVTSFFGFEDSPLEALRVDTNRALSRLSDTVGITQVRAAAAVIEKIYYQRDVNFGDITVVSARIPYNTGAPGPSVLPVLSVAVRPTAIASSLASLVGSAADSLAGSTTAAPVDSAVNSQITITKAPPTSKAIESTQVAPTSIQNSTELPASTGMPAWGWLLIGSGVFAVAGGTAFYLANQKEERRR